MEKTSRGAGRLQRHNAPAFVVDVDVDRFRPKMVDPAIGRIPFAIPRVSNPIS
jgi:hypothetical protein